MLPGPLFERLWRARVRAMLRRRERHVCKLQTVSDIMVRLAMPALVLDITAHILVHAGGDLICMCAAPFLSVMAGEHARMTLELMTSACMPERCNTHPQAQQSVCA